MSRRAVVFLGSLGVLVLLAAALFFFFRFQISKSFSQIDGSLTVGGLQREVTVSRNAQGVPAISARDEHDLFFSLGYVHAQDRLWQMDMGRRVGEGRLSEILGPETLPFDRMFRIIGLRRVAEEVERHLSDTSRAALQAYADGVNAFIKGHEGKFPVEFDLLRYSPEPWTPLHSILIGRVMAWELNLSWWTDLTFGMIAEKVGLDRALDIFPTYPADVAPTVKTEEWKQYAQIPAGYMRTAQSFCAMSGAIAMAGGSNAFVVSPQRSATGSVLLANDTHLRLQLPSQWYEVALRSPGFSAGGMSVPGIPGVVAGRNDSIAWGITNVMADDADFYIERVDSADTTKYLSDAGAWEHFTYINEEIPVKGESPVPLSIRLTGHGPVVSDIKTMLQRATVPYVATMRWTGNDPDNQIDAILAIDRARNWREFVAGVRQFTVPGQNFVYGDVAGNIGYWCGVKLPIRGRQSSVFPLPGWQKESAWKGYVPFDQLPHLFNPPEGFIATANNKIVDDSYPYHISDLWEPASRILRLREALGKPGEKISVRDMERLQNDMFSFQAKETVPYILQAFKDSTLGLPEENTVFEYLRNWNFTFSKDDAVTSIFQQFYVRLLINMYEDEMGGDLFHDFVILANVPIRVTSRLLREGTSPWFDDVRTPQVETRDDIIRRSLREALGLLRQRFGVEMKTWRWGELHKVTLQHPFGMKKPLNRIFDVGPFPIGGASTALMSGEYSYNTPFDLLIGASFRQIFDLGVGPAVYSILPSGQSGQVFHPNYSDQTDLWLNGAYHSRLWYGPKTATKTLVLHPR